MKALKNLVIGSTANLLTEKQMKMMKGGDNNDPWYCHCADGSGSEPVQNCDDCKFVCSEGWYTCDHIIH